MVSPATIIAITGGFIILISGVVLILLGLILTERLYYEKNPEKRAELQSRYRRYLILCVAGIIVGTILLFF